MQINSSNLTPFMRRNLAKNKVKLATEQTHIILLTNICTSNRNNLLYKYRLTELISTGHLSQKESERRQKRQVRMMDPSLSAKGLKLSKRQICHKSTLPLTLSKNIIYYQERRRIEAKLAFKRLHTLLIPVALLVTSI